MKKDMEFQPLRRYAQRHQRLWLEVLQAIMAAQLPVSFYSSESSSATDANERLDEEASDAFSIVRKWADRIESGEIHVRPLSEEEAGDMLATLDDCPPPADPADSVGEVQDLADSLMKQLQAASQPPPLQP